MAISVNTRRNVWFGRGVRKTRGTSFGEVNFSELIPPIEESDEADFNQQPQMCATRQALEELEDTYQTLLESLDVDFDPKQLNRYIARAEKRRGVAYSEAEKKKFEEMAHSEDPNIRKLFCLELSIGVPKKVKDKANAAMGRLVTEGDNDEALVRFINDSSKDPNLVAFVRTILMRNRIERVMARVDHYKRRYHAVRGQVRDVLTLKFLVPPAPVAATTPQKA